MDRQTAVSPPLVSEVPFDLDPSEAARHKAQRAYELHAIRFPQLRLIGMSIVALLVLVHNAWLLPGFSWIRVGNYASFLLAYSLLSWGILYSYYRRVPTVDLGSLFLLLDLGVWTSAIYFTGGEQSWLFFLLIVRNADQVPTTFRWSVLVAHIATLCYALLLLYLTYVEQRAIAWPPAAAKILALYGTNLYIALAARTAERLRQRTSAAMQTARQLVKQLEEQASQLHEAKVQAEAASAAKSTFLANMSHELRTPLNAIIGYSEMLIEDAENPEPEGAVDDLLHIHDAGKHLLATINTLLDLSKIEAGAAELYWETFAVQDLIDEVVAMTAPLVAHNGNVLEISVAPEVGQLFADRTKVRQCLTNLLSNACKFTEQGSIRLEVTQETGIDSDWLLMRVCDTGIGIAPEQQAQLFQAFVQVDASTTRKYDGTGLGLAISQRFCQMMGGAITLESALGHGATFTIHLPATPCPPPSATYTHPRPITS